MYKTTNMIMKNPIYLLSKNNATAVNTKLKVEESLLKEVKLDLIQLTVKKMPYLKPL